MNSTPEDPESFGSSVDGRKNLRFGELGLAKLSQGHLNIPDLRKHFNGDEAGVDYAWVESHENNPRL